jgi:hypothetical protein
LPNSIAVQEISDYFAFASKNEPFARIDYTTFVNSDPPPSEDIELLFAENVAPTWTTLLHFQFRFLDRE